MALFGFYVLLRCLNMGNIEDFNLLINNFDEMIMFKSKTDMSYSNSFRLDLGLLALLNIHKSNNDLIEHISLKLSAYDFHKGFRQYDIIEPLDNVVWQLLSGSDLFFKAYDLYCKGVKFDEFIGLDGNSA